MSLPHLPGIITSDEVRHTAASIAALQLPNGMIPWFPGGHCDPWNHVETAIALDIMGRRESALAAYRWLANNQHADGSWFNYYVPDGSIEDPKLDTNVTAYVAVGVWAHWLCTRRGTTPSSPVAPASATRSTAGPLSRTSWASRTRSGRQRPT